MATYVPNADDETEPTGGRFVSSAPVEFISIKEKFERTLLAPSGEALNELPDAAGRASKILAFNGAGQPTLIVGVDTGSAAALQLLLADPTSASNGDALSAVKWVGPNSAAPSVATTQHQMNEDSATVMNTIADSLKAAIRALTSTADISNQLEAYLQYCYDSRKEVVFPAGLYKVSRTILINVTGGRLAGGITWKGAGVNLSFLQKSSAFAGPLVRIFGAAAAGSGTSTSAQCHLHDMSFIGVSKAGEGILFDELAAVWVNNCQFREFNVAVDLQSTLIAWFDSNIIMDNVHGIRARRKAALSFCNLLTFKNNQIGANTGWGIDIDHSDTINSAFNQYEGNGSTPPTSAVTISNATPAVVTWASHGLVADDPVILTTSGALPTGLTASYIYYVSATGLAAGSFQVSATVGGASVATSSVGSGTHTALSPNTGAVVIRDGVDDELGACVFSTSNDRYEGNQGCDIRTEYISNSFGIIISIDNAIMAGAASSTCIAIGQARKVSVKNTWCPSGTSNWNLNVNDLLIENSDVISLVRPLQDGTSGRYITAVNARYNSVDHASGDIDSWTGTLTGVTTDVTATLSMVQQGKRIIMKVPGGFAGTSNTAAATITGLPRKYWPSGDTFRLGVTMDNGNVIASWIKVDSAGLITLYNGFSTTFTNTGTKAFIACEIQWDIP